MFPLARGKFMASGTMLPLRFFHYYVFASFLFLYLILVHYCQTHYYRDPTSAFFDPDRGYDQIYSKFRTAQANNFIREADAIASPANKTSLPTNTKASLCVGISSVKRQGVNYFESAVGSLLLDLTEREREDIHLVLFIPHTDPTVHPSYSSGWLSATADTVLLYDLPEDQMKHLKFLESKGGLSLEKGLFDYTYLLKACQAVGALYTVLVEDDVVALDGWHHRTRQALEDAERQTRDMGASKYLYLRLFYTHKFLGWNSEEWLIYFSCSLLVVASVGAALIITRHFLPQTNRFIPNKIIAVLCLICTPLCIILFFFAGRVSLLPPSAGVHQMPTFGCCSQALAFPHERITDMIEWYESQQEGNADTLLEAYADTHDEIRWALTPSLFQHVGVISTKYKDNGERRNAKSIWNYVFELNDPVALQLEHEMVAESENKEN